MDRRIQFIVDVINNNFYDPEEGESNPLDTEYVDIWNDDGYPVYKVDIFIDLLEDFFKEIDRNSFTKNLFIDLITENK